MSRRTRFAAIAGAVAIFAGALVAGALSAEAAASHKAPAKSAAKPAKMVTLKDGLKYQDLVVGKGAAVKNGAPVSVDYVGKLTNGTVFDASANHGGQPFAFTLGDPRLIKGWNEGMLGMKPGGVRKIIIPSALGYGPNGSPPVIPGNAILIFTITLVKVG